MKKYLFLITFIIVNIFFIIFYISKESKIIKLTYQNQKFEKKIKSLEKEKQKLNIELLTVQDHLEIKKFAQKTLGMKEIKLEQIKTISHEQIA